MLHNSGTIVVLGGDDWQRLLPPECLPPGCKVVGSVAYRRLGAFALIRVLCTGEYLAVRRPACGGDLEIRPTLSAAFAGVIRKMRERGLKRADMALRTPRDEELGAPENSAVVHAEVPANVAEVYRRLGLGSMALGVRLAAGILEERFAAAEAKPRRALLHGFRRFRNFPCRNAHEQHVF